VQGAFAVCSVGALDRETLLDSREAQGAIADPFSPVVLLLRTHTVLSDFGSLECSERPVTRRHVHFG
jgi:hypothetical protein